MKPSPRRILALWRQNPTWLPSFTEILQALGGGKGESRPLHETLEHLVSGGKLRYRNRRYGLLPDKRGGGAASASQVGESKSGQFSAHPDGFGFVSLDGGSQSVFIPPHAIAGALDGDRVRIEPNRPRPDGRSSGRVVEILARARQQVRGTVQFEDGDSWVKPFNRKLPFIFIAPAAESPYRQDDIVDAVITDFPADAGSAPGGRITRRVKHPDAPESIVAAILAEQNIPTAFSRQTQKEMAALRKNRPATAMEGRHDLTDLPFITIDGEDARDFDDAVCLLPGRKGTTRVLVAIADVAEYVRPGSAVDGEAYARGTSVYFPARVVPMLPEELSNDLCSLRPGEPRLTLTCDMEFDGAGARQAYRIYTSTIRSRARLTYGQVVGFLETGKPGALADAKKLAPMIEGMGAFSRVLIEKRRARGA
ncbi:MAG: RNB domain-containing ribonuclease, partial [SAR324 cluster bacterium]|nr:RNB domain-containing ribonuclease [SAR324 cluster bacterium]